MKKVFGISALFLVLALSGCSISNNNQSKIDNEDLKNQVNDLQQQVGDLKQEINKTPNVATSVPVITEDLNDQGVISVKVFFPNSIIDPGFLDCSVVRPVVRIIPYTVTTAKASLEELVKGLSAQEESQGFQTSIDNHTTINSLSIKGETAYVDFSKDLQTKNVGLCAGQFIQAQIRQTLLQFPTVKNVEISIDGDKDFVQP